MYNHMVGQTASVISPFYSHSLVLPCFIVGEGVPVEPRIRGGSNV